MIKKILVPLDGTVLAEKALSYAEALAQKFSAELILMRVLQPVLLPMEGLFDNGKKMVHYPEAFRDESEANLSRLYLKAIQDKLQVPARIEVLEGRPEADSIVEMACWESVDLIVMSTHGRSGIDRWVHGSVANEVFQHASCPVFFVRAKETEGC